MDHPTAQATRDRLFREFDAVVNEAEQLLSRASQAGGEGADDLRASIEQGIARAGERISALGVRTVQRAEDAAATADEYVHQNPWIAIGIAAALAGAAGLAAGLLAARR